MFDFLQNTAHNLPGALWKSLCYTFSLNLYFISCSFNEDTHTLCISDTLRLTHPMWLCLKCCKTPGHHQLDILDNKPHVFHADPGVLRVKLKLKRKNIVFIKNILVSLLKDSMKKMSITFFLWPFLSCFASSHQMRLDQYNSKFWIGCCDHIKSDALCDNTA